MCVIAVFVCARVRMCADGVTHRNPIALRGVRRRVIRWA